jgi:uncharacterized protein YqgC (DUF456 family)
MALLALAGTLALSLFLVPLGLPGLWVMVAAALVYNWFVPAAAISGLAIGIAFALAVVAEILEWTLSSKYTTKYGGSTRAGWGAILGGLVGAVMGVPVPVIGSVIGAFVGAFAGAFVMEYTLRESTGASATRVAKGALIGRVAAAAAKTGLGCALAATLLLSAWMR